MKIPQILVCVTVALGVLAARSAGTAVLTAAVDLGTAIPDGTGDFTGLVTFALDGSTLAFSGSGGSGQQGVYLFDNGTLTRVADATTAIPGGSGGFTSFGGPLLDATDVAFVGLGTGQHGLYRFDGANLGVIADFDTPVPGGAGTFDGLFDLALADGDVGFRGTGSGQQGQYLFSNGALSRVADLATPVPGGTGTFTDFSFAPASALSGGMLAFHALASGQEGIYLFDGVQLERVADLTTAIPGGTGSFTGFSGQHLSMNGGHLLFFGLGNGGQQGLYLFDGNTLARVADTGTPIPGGSGTFTAFGAPQLSGGTVAFLGQGVGQSGIYLFDAGTLVRVADHGTLIPGGSGTFNGFQGPALSGTSVAFYAQGSSGQQGIYLADGGTLTTVADTSTAIPGGTGAFLSFGFSPGASPGHVAFLGIGSAGQVGFYLADVTPPTSTTTVPTSTTTSTTGVASSTTTTTPGATSSTTSTVPVEATTTTTLAPEACLTPTSCYDALAAVLPSPSAATSKAGRRITRKLHGRYTTIGTLLRRAAVRSGKKQTALFAKARADVQALVTIATGADAKGTLGVPLAPLENAATLLLQRIA